MIETSFKVLTAGLHLKLDFRYTLSTYNTIIVQSNVNSSYIISHLINKLRRIYLRSNNCLLIIESVDVTI